MCVCEWSVCWGVAVTEGQAHRELWGQEQSSTQPPELLDHVSCMGLGLDEL